MASWEGCNDIKKNFKNCREKEKIKKKNNKIFKEFLLGYVKICDISAKLKAKGMQNFKN